MDDDFREAAYQRYDDMCSVLFEFQEAMRAVLGERYPVREHGDMPQRLMQAAIDGMKRAITAENERPLGRRES